MESLLEEKIRFDISDKKSGKKESENYIHILLKSKLFKMPLYVETPNNGYNDKVLKSL